MKTLKTLAKIALFIATPFVLVLLFFLIRQFYLKNKTWTLKEDLRLDAGENTGNTVFEPLFIPKGTRLRGRYSDNWKTGSQITTLYNGRAVVISTVLLT